MKNFKTVSAFLLCVALTAAYLVGCGTHVTPEPTQTTEATVTQIQSPTEPTLTHPSEPSAAADTVPQIPLLNELQSSNPHTLSEWVFTNYEQTFSWRDQVGNFCCVSITLPAMAPVADFALAFNAAIYEMGTDIVEETVECQETACSNFLLSVTYEAYLHDDILSIVLIEDTAVDYTVYTAYSFDLEEKRALSTAELCDELLDMDYPSFILATNAIAAHRFAEQYGDYIDDLQNQYISSDSYFETVSTEDVDLYHEILAAIPYDAMCIGDRSLFVGENGQTMLIYDAPSMAGAASYPTVIPFDLRETDWQRPTEAAAYGELFCLMDYVDGAYTDAYCAILMQAFLADGEDFIEYAAKATAGRQDSIVSLLHYALTDTVADQFLSVCRDIMDDDDITDSESALVNRLLTLSGV